MVMGAHILQSIICNLDLLERIPDGKRHTLKNNKLAKPKKGAKHQTYCNNLYSLIGQSKHAND